MRLKDGVSLCKGSHHLRPETLDAMLKVSALYEQEGIKGSRAVVTSIMDGKHKTNSKHYIGWAFDCRTWNKDISGQMSDEDKEALAQKIREKLGRNYDVVVEPTHIHVEYDPDV